MGFILALLLGCEAELKVGGDTATEVVVADPDLGMHVTEVCGQTAIGDVACDFALLDQNEKFWQLYEDGDSVVVLDFSTSWCGPCQAAAESTQALQDEYEGRVSIVTILIDGPQSGIAPTSEDIDIWVESHEITSAPILQGSRELMLDATGVSGYSISAFPTYIYLSKGKIHSGHSGFSEEYVRQTVDGLL
jgi:thiol-disulfide isomerase/thioredoxin